MSSPLAFPATPVRSLFGLLLFAACPAAGLAAEIHALTLDSGKPGPTVVIVAPEGGAGSAGLDTLRQLQYRKPTAGKLVLAEAVADFSSRACPAGWETIPTFAELEKRFPAHRRMIFREAIDSWSYVQGANGDTVAGDGPEAAELVKALRNIPSSDWRNWAGKPAPEGDTTITVTTNAKENLEKGLRLSLRQREFRTAADTLLRRLGMADTSPGDAILFPEHSPGVTRVAVFDDNGAQNATGHAPAWLRANLSHRKDLLVEVVGAPEIRAGALARADVLVMGGGKAGLEATALGDEGRATIQRFVHDGGGYVGICAGAYLGSRPTKKWTRQLGLLPIDVEATSVGKDTPLAWETNPTGPARTENAELHGGPKFVIPDGEKRIGVWARYTRDETEEGKKYALAGTPAVVSGTFGKGKVVLFSTHCERRPSAADIFPSAVRWCDGAGDAAGQQ